MGSTDSAFVGQLVSPTMTPRNSRAHVSSCHERAFLSHHHHCTTTTALGMMTPSAEESTTTSSLVGIDWVSASVTSVLNDIFDPAEIARGAATNKLDAKMKKMSPKKRGKPPTEEERAAIIQSAVSSAQPFSPEDAMVTVGRSEFGNYQSNAARSLAKAAGLKPRECAKKIVDGLNPLMEGIMEAKISERGFINLNFRKDYLKSGGRLAAISGGGSGGNAVGMIETEIFSCSKKYMRRVIGQGGVTVNDLQKRSGCDIQINQNVPVGQDCQINMTGSRKGIDTAKKMLQEIIELGPNQPE